MSGLMKVFDRLAEEEDDRVMEVMTKFYGPVLQISLLFPSWKRPNLKFTFLCVAIYVFAICLHFLVLVFSTIRLTDHFDLASMTFHYGLIFAFLQIVTLLVNKNRKIMGSMHRLMASDMGNYRSGRIYEEGEPQVLEKNKRRELMRFLCLPGMIMGLAALSLLAPYIKKLTREKSSDEAHYTKYGVNLNLPIATYYPFPTHTGILHMAAVLGQLSAGAVFTIVLMGMELILFRLSQAIIFELKVLQYGVKTIFRRAAKLYRITYPEHNTSGLRISDPNLQHCIGLCFNDTIDHHYRIKKLLKTFEGFMNWPAAMGYTFGTGVIGLSLINMLDAHEAGSYENLVIFTLMTIAEVLNMFILSTFGEDITTQSKILRDVLYDIDWHKLNIKNRRTMLNFQTGITNPEILKAGGIVALCMDTFSSIINTSYSFFNLVNANKTSSQ